MIWLTLLMAHLRYQRVFIQQQNRDFIWSGVVLWVTPWAVALQVSLDDPDSVQTVVIDMDLIEEVRDFSPAAARCAVKASYRDDPPDEVRV